MAIFTYLLDYPANLQREPKVLVAQFGDGYVQRAGDGINTNLEVWNLTASNIPISVGEAIDTFLSTHGGHTSFEWTAPGINTIEGSYLCPAWKVSKQGEDKCSFSATFIEAVEL